MLFRTPVEIPEYSFHINHHHRVISVGSCFATHISAYLQYYKFGVLSNPNGIVYNPISIADCLYQVLDGSSFQQEILSQHQGLWYSFSHHSAFSHPDRQQCLQGINESIHTAHQHLQQTQLLILTLGTSFIYEHQMTGQVVANCHKLPASTFVRKQLSVSTIVTKLQDIFQAYKQRIPNLEIILTVSPIRHIRDGAIENQRSKSTLLLAAHELSQQNYVHYFPAYEIMMDELRDYRFYERDMIHPSAVAIDYILEKFAATFFDEDTKRLNTKVKKIRQAQAHRPFHPESTAHQKFLNKQLKEIDILQREYPELDWSDEINQFKNELS